jgi:hypothetical protein
LGFKFTALATVPGGIEMWGKVGIAIRKMYCTGPWKLATVPLYKPLKSTMGAYVHKTTYGPLIDTALHMRANPSLGQGVGPGNLDFFQPQMALA